MSRLATIAERLVQAAIDAEDTERSLEHIADHK